ncbi:MAG: prepilin-type N-terminal cleavage/methylation domain-containing protein [Rhodobacteraceae bacterium]|nr:prepilin-type N-terminal cleavage/methylation domain-containing protein [Paracoccaceae bacterium]
MTAPQNSRGFTLIEAIVALAIIGILLLPIMSFVSQASLQLQSAGESNARNLAAQNVIAFFETINPSETPSGSAEFSGLGVSWASKQVVPANTDIRPGSGLPGFSVGFYEVTVDARRLSQQDTWFSLNLRKAGYRRLLQSLSPIGSNNG